MTSGVIIVDLDPTFFGDAIAASAFSAAGDAYGYVILTGRHVEVHFASDSGSIGLVSGLPVCTITAPILAATPLGSKAAITASAGYSPWTDTQRQKYSVTVVPGAVTVGGALAIQRVEPSTGELAAGSVVHIFGIGFTASTAVDIAGAVVSSAQVQGSDQIEVTLGAPVEITGRRVRLQEEANGGSAEFFPAFLADPVTTSPDHPLANARPILPLQSRVAAETGDLARRTGWILVQNPNSVRVDAAIQTLSLNSYVALEQIVALAPGAATVVAWGSVSGGGGTVRVLASAPVRSIALWEVRDRFGDFTSSGSQPMGHSPLSPTPLLAGPGSISWVWRPGSSKPAPQFLTVGPADTQSITVTVAAATESGGAWLSATPQSLVVSGAGGREITLAADPTALGPGIYRGTVTITPAPVAFRIILPVVVAVVLTVSATPVVQTVAACCFQFDTPSGAPQSHVFTISADLIPGAFSTTVVTDGGGDWLAVRPSAATSPAQVTVSLNAVNTPPGEYSGEVLIAGSGGTVYMPVTLRVYGGTQLWADDFYLLFQAKPGDTALPALTTRITARCVEVGCGTTATPESIPWTPSVKTNSGGNWLVAASTGGDLKVSANAAGLAPGVYTGAVTLASAGATGPTQVPVVLLVAQPGELPALTASPSSLTFSTTAASAQSTCVQAGRMEVPLAVATSTTNSGNWLRAANTSVSEFPCVIHVSVETAGLATGVYTGKVTASASGQSVGIPVNLVIPADGDSPFVGAVLNAASAIEGPSCAGEMITIRGNFDPLRCSFCAPPSTAGAAAVSVDGVAIPILSSSATSLTLALPRWLAGKNVAMLQVNYGTFSTLRGLPLVDAAPGIFTLDRSGQGPAAVLNQDNSVNGAASPADRGSVIQVFATGIGGDPAQIAIAGVAARITFAGPAPAAVDGLFQVNAVVPPDAPVGTSVPIVLTAGPYRSQNGATIAVQ